MFDLNINNDKAKIKADYDFEIYQELKKVPDSAYNIEEDAWNIDTVYLKQLIKTLHDMNKNIENIIPKLRGITTNKKYSNKKDDQVIKTIRFKVLKENNKTLIVGFDYDQQVLNLVKQIEGRQYIPEQKAWKINRGNEDWLYEKLSELKYVDLSELLPYTSHNKKEKISLSPKNFPNSIHTPKEYQLRVAERLIENKKVINALEAGLGKTMITVMACEYLQKKTLIVCPATIKYTWEQEIYKVNPDADVIVLDSKSKWQDANYVIINYDILENFINEIEDANFEIVVFDEAHKLRGVDNRGRPSSKRAKLSLKIAKDKEYVFPITATPFINYTKDIFNLMVLVDHPSTNNWYIFANTYCNPVRTKFGTTFNGSSNQEQLNNRLYPRYMIRLKTEDHIDLPDRVRRFVPLKINMAKYNKAVKDYMDNRSSLEDNGKHLVYFQAMAKELSKEKAKHTVKIIKDAIEQNKSVVVFSKYKEVVNSLYDKFEAKAVKLHGDMTDKERHKAVEDFQNGDKTIFIGTIDAASEGITLTKSNYMIVNDFHWSPVVMVNQMEKRIHRLSQTQSCLIDYLYVPDAKLDQIQLEMLEQKLNDASLIVDGKKEEFFIEEIIKRF